MQNMRSPIGTGAEFSPEDVILFIFHLFYYLYIFFLPALHSHGSEFLLVICFALGVAVGKVGCTKLAPWPPEQDAHTFGLSLQVFGCCAGRSDAPLCCRDVP